MAKAYLDKLSAFIKVATSDYSDNINLECKHFFSGTALYVNQQICITLTPVGLAIKLPQETKEKLLPNKTALPLRYFPKGPIKQDYVLFPDGLEKRGNTTGKYVKQSIEYILTAAKPVKKK